MAVTEESKLGGNVKNIPKSETVSGEIVSIKSGNREDFRSRNEDGEWSYDEAEATDDFVEIVVDVEYEGDVYTVQENFEAYQKPDPRSTHGKLLEQYGEVEKGDAVDVKFDKDGNGSIVK